MQFNKLLLKVCGLACAAVLDWGFTAVPSDDPIDDLRKGFLNPPTTARPGVYWYFMDGNLSKDAMTKDLESMKAAGIESLIFLEVNVGVPRGHVDFLSDEWQRLFAHAVKEAERLGIEITLGVGPGWTGSGGPWVGPEQSMQHLVASTVTLSGGSKQRVSLPVPPPHKPYFGEGGFTPAMRETWNAFYEDVAVLAFPTPADPAHVEGIDEKSLVYRAPFTSLPGVKPHLLQVAGYDTAAGSPIQKREIIDLTDQVDAQGTLTWDVPPGNWTVMRFVARNNGATTRPAPVPGLGFESDKFDTVALNAHLDRYVGTLLKKIGGTKPHLPGGLKRLHMDSWEMGAQNWTPRFREEFRKRRGYDPLPFFPVYAGNVVESMETSERFLWDLRQTAQELVLENHAGHIKAYGRRHGLTLSIEPYDMNPTADLELGAVADVPMAEFWSRGFGFDASFSVIEATSIAHVNGQARVPAEAFTAQNNEGWKLYPGKMKNQTDWALAAGLNQLVFHTFQNQHLPDSLRPGMTMGPYGVQWNRNQTWWPMVGAYHQYLARAQFLLQQGNTVADILYLAPEGAPHVFLPPASAILGDTIPDRRGYNFDACAPSQLYKAAVKDHRIVFPGGASYRILVMPHIHTITPALLAKIDTLVREGAVVVGLPPSQSPSLSDYPQCDEAVRQLAGKMWGTSVIPQQPQRLAYGKGAIHWGGALSRDLDRLYPRYEHVADILSGMDVVPDFESDGSVRYTHRRGPDWDCYFVANRTDSLIQTAARFRSTRGAPQLWDPVSGTMRPLPVYTVSERTTSIPLTFEPYQSYFIVFPSGQAADDSDKPTNFADYEPVFRLDGPWEVSFDSKWGGPANTSFDTLADWTTLHNEGIKYYSGTAVYRKTFDLPQSVTGKSQLWLDLGEVCNIARVKLNGKPLGVVWTAPWKVAIGDLVEDKQNVLEIEVTNLWPNRLIGDERLPDDGIDQNGWPDWLVTGKPRPSKRYTFTTYRHYGADSPLLRSGLLGPVVIQQASW